jgi:bis(5'-nucleosyl)-tetraphosphatase (symmetrical)
VPNRVNKDALIVFGHWSALGLQHRNQVFSLDTGCLWGGQLTALALETKVITQVTYHLKDNPVIKHFKK